MQWISTIGEFIRDLRAQRLRTFMTIFGIVWGTVAILVLLAFGNGFQRQMMTTMYGIGESIIIVYPGTTAKPFEGYGPNRDIRLREEDADLLSQEISQIKLISPEYSNWNAPLRVETRVRNPNVTGIIPEYGDIRNIFPRPGSRWINALDIELKRRIVFLGDELAEYLFQDVDPVGNSVFIGNTPFLVVGVMQPKEQDSSYNSRDMDRAFIPASTFVSLFGHRYVRNIVIIPNHATLTPYIQDRMFEILGKKYKFDPTDREALMVWDTTEFQKMVYYIFLGFNLFMGIIGAFTLTVGGIGVANIMYVVVQERTKEIGIKRSVGAKKHHIMIQFFFETFFIIGIGALIGTLISLGLIFLISMMPIDEFVGTPSVSLWVALVAVSLLGGIGFIAGFFPARKAANLNVVDCLHY